MTVKSHRVFLHIFIKLTDKLEFVEQNVYFIVLCQKPILSSVINPAAL